MNVEAVKGRPVGLQMVELMKQLFTGPGLADEGRNEQNHRDGRRTQERGIKNGPASDREIILKLWFSTSPEGRDQIAMMKDFIPLLRPVYEALDF